MERFSIRYGVWKPLLVICGLGPGVSGVEVSDTEIVVRMGWGFRATLPRRIVGRVALSPRGAGGSVGVHGWRGVWLVNGAVSGIVDIELSETARCRVLGFSVALKTLRISLEEPETFVARFG